VSTLGLDGPDLEESEEADVEDENVEVDSEFDGESPD